MDALELLQSLDRGQPYENGHKRAYDGGIGGKAQRYHELHAYDGAQYAGDDYDDQRRKIERFRMRLPCQLLNHFFCVVHSGIITF